MSVATDPALYRSDFERINNERYFTEPWVTEALVNLLPYIDGAIWEPAAGRGDMSKVLEKHHIEVVPSDIDVSEYTNENDVEAFELDFLSVDPKAKPEYLNTVNAIVTNPPYGGNINYGGDRMALSEAFLRHALSFDFELVAMLMRSEFNSASSRLDLFDRPDFSFELVLTSRPRWDWWKPVQPGEKRSGPRHNFSWFVWSKESLGKLSTQFWQGRNGNE